MRSRDLLTAILPSVEAIRRRLAFVEADRRALQILLRAALEREQQSPQTDTTKDATDAHG